ncbi:binding partner of ACD11 1 [Euphorbia lathyris]|uniref:binding partner of ACD11 1 n=1 Tax=Euphorbia lathyris TaxID=212925 RepID=UPI003313D009
MYPGGYTAEVTCLSPKATRSNVYDFFSHCGEIEHVEIIRSGEHASTAYVTFKGAYGLETAILLSGATIVDQRVCIMRWGAYIDDSFYWNVENNVGTTGIHVSQYASTPGEAVSVAQEVVKTMVAKGYDLGKDALMRAKAFDESHKVSTSAAAKVAELSTRIGLTDKIQTSMQTVKSVDEKFRVSDITASAILVTGTAALVAGKSVVAAANAVLNSSYVAKGAVWVSDVLVHAAQAAADFGKNQTE